MLSLFLRCIFAKEFVNIFAETENSWYDFVTKLNSFQLILKYGVLAQSTIEYERT